MVTIRPDLVGSYLLGHEMGEDEGYLAQKVVDFTEDCDAFGPGYHPTGVIKYGRHRYGPVAVVHNYGPKPLHRPGHPEDQDQDIYQVHASEVFTNPGQATFPVFCTTMDSRELARNAAFATFVGNNFAIDPSKLSEIIYTNHMDLMELSKAVRSPVTVREAPALKARRIAVAALQEIFERLLLNTDWALEREDPRSLTFPDDLIRFFLFYPQNDLEYLFLLKLRSKGFTFSHEEGQGGYPGKFTLTLPEGVEAQRLKTYPPLWLQDLTNFMANRLATIVRNVGRVDIAADSIHGTLLPEAVMRAVALEMRTKHGINGRYRSGNRERGAAWIFDYGDIRG